jgi:putative toxin-antitoxin system antitoxin component (TIGR02293 family)
MGQASVALPQTSFWIALELNLDKVEAGVPVPMLAKFVEESGLRFSDLYEVVIPARTLKHRKARQENLTVDESDKFARLVRIYDETVKVFGTTEKAIRWLTKPKHRFAERTPIQMLRTEIGSRMVEEMLVQIDEGMFV